MESKINKKDKDEAIKQIKILKNKIKVYKKFIKDNEDNIYGSDVAFIIAAKELINIRQKEIETLKKLYKI